METLTDILLFFVIMFAILFMLFCFLYCSMELVNISYKNQEIKERNKTISKYLYEIVDLYGFIDEFDELKPIYNNTIDYALYIYDKNTIYDSVCANGVLLLLIEIINKHIKQMILNINKYIKTNNKTIFDNDIARYEKHLNELLKLEPDLKQMKNLNYKTQLIRYMEKRFNYKFNDKNITKYETFGDLLKILKNYDKYIDMLFCYKYIELYKDFKININKIKLILDYDKYLVKLNIRRFLYKEELI